MPVNGETRQLNRRTCVLFFLLCLVFVKEQNIQAPMRIRYLQVIFCNSARWRSALWLSSEVPDAAWMRRCCIKDHIIVVLCILLLSKLKRGDVKHDLQAKQTVADELLRNYSLAFI